MWNPDLVLDLLDSASKASGEDEISISYVEPNIGFVLGTNAGGEIVVLGNQDGEALPIDGNYIKLELNKNLTYDGGSIQRAFQLSFANLTDEHALATYAIVNGLHELFLKCAGKVPIDAVRSLALSNFRLSNREEELGLFGELIFILSSAETESCVLGWHEAPKDPFDFKLAGDRFEVKTTSSPRRRHWFSLNQVVNNQEFALKYVSIRTSALVDGGSTCADLVHEIRSQLPASALAIFDLRLNQYPWLDYTTGFDRHQALQSLAIFNQDEVPTPVFSAGNVLAAKWLLEFPEPTDSQI
jgi:hypothetical protein